MEKLVFDFLEITLNVWLIIIILYKFYYLVKEIILIISIIGHYKGSLSYDNFISLMINLGYIFLEWVVWVGFYIIVKIILFL